MAHGVVMHNGRKQNPRLAATLILVATAFIAATTLLAKLLGTDTLGPPLHPLQISHGRFVFAFIGLASVAMILRPKFDRIHWQLHIGRTSFGWIGVTLMFASVAFIPMSDATAITFLNPVFAMMLAIPLLGERVGPWRWTAAAIALVGALILLRPTPASFQSAAALALGAACVMGMELIFIKKLAGKEPVWRGDRDNRRAACFCHALDGTMGGPDCLGSFDGLCTDRFHQRDGTRRCELCRAVQLCHTDIRGPLRFPVIPSGSRSDIHLGRLYYSDRSCGSGVARGPPEGALTPRNRMQLAR